VTTPRFHWFLPTGGDDSHLDQSSHGVGINDHRSAEARAATPSSSTHRAASLQYLTQVAQAADSLGFESVLTPTGAHCQDAWLVTAALLSATQRLKFMVALRPGLVAPALSAQMIATFQRLSQGRLLLNVVAGGSAAEQRGYGDFAEKDERYERAEEFLAVIRSALTGKTYTHQGKHFRVEDGRLNDVPDQVPDVYLGGSSAAAIDVTARQAEVYLTWGEPPDLVAEKLAAVRVAAEREGRTVRFGIRLHVITRRTADQAWNDAESLISGLDEATVAARQRSLSTLESVGQQRMLGLHGGDRSRLLVAPNLWAGIGLVRGGAGTALVGSHEEVAARIREYQALGIDEFILSGYPHLEEAYTFAEGVFPHFR
jgi:alkanesulfonate monooxygenase